MGASAQHQASLERVLTRLEDVTGYDAKVEGGQYKTLCPAHNDQNPSLTVHWDDGKTYVHCHAGCTGESPRADPTPVVSALGLATSDLFDEVSHQGWRNVTDLDAQRRRRKQQTGPRRYEPAADLAPRVAAKSAKGEQAGQPYVEAWHLYQHPDTGDIAWAAIRIVQPLTDGYDKSFFYVHRDEQVHGKRIYLGTDPDTGKKLFESLPDGWASKMPSEHRIQTLFHLDALRSEVAAGRTIYIVEGESDVNAARFAGLAATTAPKGAGKWQSHHSDELAGADVVVVADCDDEGIKGAESVVRSLLGTAQSIRVVQAQTGKDLREHLAAGHSPDELVAVDLGIAELNPEQANRQMATAADTASGPDDTYADAPGANIVDDPHTPNEKPTYLIRNGEIVERTWRSEGSGDDKVHRARYKTMLGCAAWVTEVTETDDGDDDVRYVQPTRDQVWHIERRGTDGDIVDELDLRFPIDQIESGEWVAHWPWPDTIMGHKRAERDRMKTAILQARPAPTRRTKVYTAPGWRQTDTGPIYVHGAGAIGHGGHLDVDVDLGPVLSRTALPEPTTDAEQLRDAFFHGTDALRTLPGRIQAPLRGLMFTALVSPIEMLTHLEGPKGTKKTALARLMLQHIAPLMRYGRGVKEMVSGASDISTTTGMARILGMSKDVLLLIDDLAPDRGGAQEARVRLGELARKTYNGSAGTKGNIKPREVVNELPPRCSLLTTGEIVADGSAGSRCMNINVGPDVVPDDDVIRDLEQCSRVEDRSLIGASYLQWVAERRESLLEWREQLRETYLQAWRLTLQTLSYPSEVISRTAEACRDYSVGELFFLTFLTERGVLTEQEADEQWHWSLHGILAAATDIDAEPSDTARNLAWTLKELLTTGRVHLTDRNGGAPVVDENPESPRRYGYTAQQRPGSGSMGTADIQWRENGTPIGAVAGDRVFLIPSEVEYQARQHRQRAERSWTETTNSLGTSLDSKGWLATHTDKHGKLHRQVGRTINNSTQRVWDLPRWVLDDEDDDQGGDGPDPNPLNPLLMQRPGWLELPIEPTDETAAELPAAVGLETTPPAPDHGHPPQAVVSPLRDDTDHEAAAESAPTPDSDVSREEHTPASTTTTTEHPAQSPPLATLSTSTTPDEWTYRMAMVDLDAVYLPEQDGTITPLPQSEPPSAATIAEFGEAFGLRQGRYGIGHIHLSPRLSDHLGLVVDEDLTAKVNELGLNQRQDLTDWRSKRNVAAAEQLAERGSEFMNELHHAGWQVNRLGPRFTIRRPDPDAPEDSPRTRAFTVVLEAYTYMWEPDERDPSGPDQQKQPLPDSDDEPGAYCRQLTNRLAWAGELLGVPWQASAASTGAELIDRLPVRMKKDPDTGAKHTDWRRLGAEAIPEQALQANRVGGQHMWEPHNRWAQAPTDDTLAAAREIVLFDERYSYLPRARSLAFGYGEPEHIEPAAVAQRLADGEHLYGLVLLRLPTWDVATLPPPHPDMPTPAAAEGTVIRRWTSMRTAWLLANLGKHTQFEGEDLSEFIEDAWVWPHTHRLFNKWADTVREARAHAEQQIGAAHSDDWAAVEAMVKSVYTGYLGKLASRRVLKTGSERYHHHYRPLAQATVWGEQRVQGFLKLARYAQTGVPPLFAAGTDSYGYLSPTITGDEPKPDTDDGKAGKLRVKQRLTLTDHMRQRLLDGVDGYQVFDDEVKRLEGDR